MEKRNSAIYRKFLFNKLIKDAFDILKIDNNIYTKIYILYIIILFKKFFFNN